MTGFTLLLPITSFLLFQTYIYIYIYNNKKLEKPVLNYYICNNNIKLGNNIEVENKAGI